MQTDSRSQSLRLLLALLACFWIKAYAQSNTTATPEGEGNLITTTLMPSSPGDNATSLCTPVDMDHICRNLPGRNTVYQFPSNPPRMIDLSLRTIQIGFTLLRSLDPPINKVCESSIQRVTCIIGNPPCNPESGLLLDVCPQSCNAHNRLLNDGTCDSVFDHFENIQDGSIIPDIRATLLVLFAFKCNNKSSYNFYDDAELDSRQCTDLFKPGEAEEILSKPNKCVENPPSLCDLTIGSTGYYLPLEGRGNDTYIEILHNLFESTNNTCKNVLLNLICYYEYPPCDPSTGNAISVCSESCDAFSSLVGSCLLAIGPDSPLVETIRGINCSDHFSYLYPFTLIDNTTCVNASGLGSLLTASLLNSETIDVSVIAGATVGALIFIIIVSVIVLSLIILIYCKKHKRFHSLNVPGYNLTIRSYETREARANRIYTLEPAGAHHEDDENMDDTATLSETERTSYEKIFSSILVPFASLAVGEEIGQGAFGKVYRGEMLKIGANTTKEEVAIKTIKHLSSHEEVEAFFAESFVMKDFKHPNVLSLTGICFDTPDGIPYILLPYMANGSLKDYLKRKRVHVTDVDTFPEDLSMSILVKMCLEIAQGMQYLSGMKFVHRDLAARNCMVDTNLTIKVGDFGLARDIYCADYYRANKNTKVPVKWMPPETLHDGISNEKTDIWSYGVTCWEVFSLGRTPYPGIHNQDILKHIACGERLDRPTLCPKMLYDMIMYKSWELRPENRPSFDDLVHQLLEYWEEENAYL